MSEAFTFLMLGTAIGSFITYCICYQYVLNILKSRLKNDIDDADRWTKARTEFRDDLYSIVPPQPEPIIFPEERRRK